MTSPFWPDGADALGHPLPTYRNVYVGLNEILDVRLNTFSSCFEANGNATGGNWLVINDEVMARIRHAFADIFAVDPTSHLRHALRMLGYENKCNPVAEEFNSYQWNKEARLESFFPEVCGAENTEINRAAGSLLWRSLVERGTRPGCPCPTAIILIGEEGAGKSSLLRIMAGSSAYFTDREVLHLPAERQQEALRGRLVVEAAELGGMDRLPTGKVKNFFTQTHISARGAWETSVSDQPLSCITVVTANERFVLPPTEGNRRFVPVVVKRIDLEKVAALRTQYIAEACVLQAERAALTLPEALWARAAKLRRSFTIEDPLIDTLSAVAGVVIKDEERLPWETVWQLLGLDVARRSLAQKKRIVAALTGLGWSYEPARTFRIGDVTHKGFRRPVAESESDDKSVKKDKAKKQ